MSVLGVIIISEGEGPDQPNSQKKNFKGKWRILKAKAWHTAFQDQDGTGSLQPTESSGRDNLDHVPPAQLCLGLGTSH